VGARVLIVDDEPDVAKYLATVLRARGHTPVVAGSVRAGFEQLSEALPDLICLDIMMPRESGVSMYIRLKQDSKTQSIPVIVISGVEPQEQFDLRTYVKGEPVPPPECFLEKPVKVEEFVATVERLVSSRPATSGKEDR
jgi:two-component system phosphate regulon response regulator PhoB